MSLRGTPCDGPDRVILVHRIESPVPVLALAVLVAAFVTNVYRYAFVWGGDPEIHIIFARNALNGHWLQFNPGEYTSGETSPVYMLCVAGLLKLFGVPGAVIGMKCTGLATMLVVAWQVYAHARWRGLDQLGALLHGALFLSFPFVSLQALLGMENMPFAAAACYVLRTLLEGRLTMIRWRDTVRWVAILSLVFFLRPETMFLCAAIAACFLLQRRWRELASLATVAVIVFATIVAIQRVTAVPLYGAGVLRAATSRLESHTFELFGHTGFISGKPAQLAVYLWPMLFLCRRTNVGGERRNWAQWATYLFVVAIPILLHVICVLPNTHFSRYSLYIVATILLLCGHGANGQRGTLSAGLFVLACLVYVPAEYAQRERAMGDAYRSYAHLRESVRELGTDSGRTLSNALCKELHCVDGIPVVLAAGEVQIRGRLDERFLIRSLDGIVDFRLNRHVYDRGIDYFGYLRDRRVDYLLSLPNYATAPGHVSLSRLSRLRIDQTQTIDGVEFVGFRSEALHRNLIGVRY